MLSRFLTFLLAFALALPATSQESDESEELDLAQSACVALDHVGCLAHTRALLDADPFAAELPLLRSMRVAAHLALEQPAEALVELETLVSERRGGWSIA